MKMAEEKSMSIAACLIKLAAAFSCQGPRSKLYRIEVSPIAAQSISPSGYGLVVPIPYSQGVHDCGTIYGVGVSVRVDKCDKRVTHPVYPERVLYCDRPALHEGDHHFDCSFSVS